MICLCSKSYVSSSGPIGKVKFSLKGVNKSNFVDPTIIFEHVLKTRETVTAVNRSIRLHKNTMESYEQSKKAFVYFYCKRKMIDPIRSRALDLVLTPKRRKRTFRETDLLEEEGSKR